jgi:hypothetical protein
MVKLYSIRLDENVVAALKRLSLREGLARGRQIGWCDLIREAARERLQRGAAEDNPDREEK